jgi:hypothetical protein
MLWVIGPVGHENDHDELLNMQRQACKIAEISRLPKFSGTLKEDSLVLKLDFEGNQLPEKAGFGFISYRVRPYNPPPLRCYRCQQPQNLARGCSAPVRCLLCAGNYYKDVCTSSTFKCANCEGPHIASSQDCRYNVQAKAIDALKRSGMSYDQARQQTNLLYSNPHFRRDSQMDQSSLPSVQPLKQQNIPNNGILHINRTEVEIHRSQGSYQGSSPCSNIAPSLEITHSQVTKSTMPQLLNNGITNAVAENPLMEEEATATITNLIRSDIQKLSISICKQSSGPSASF